MKAEILLTTGQTILIDGDEVKYFFQQINDQDKFLELKDDNGKTVILNKDYVIAFHEL